MIGAWISGIARRIASPLPLPPSATTRAPLRSAMSAVPSVELPDDDEDVADVGARPADDITDRRAFLLGRDDRADVRRDVTRDGLVEVRVDRRVGEAGDVHRLPSGLPDWGSAMPGRRERQRPASTLPRML